MPKHEHEVKCEHEDVKFCARCDVTYCENCPVTWTSFPKGILPAPLPHSPFPSIPFSPPVWAVADHRLHGTTTTHGG